MTPYYSEICARLEAIDRVEKVARELDGEDAQLGAAGQASACDALFERVASLAGGFSLSKDILAVKVAEFAGALRESHVSAGQKTASTNEEAAQILTKLATAVYVDRILDDRLRQKIANEDWLETRYAQLLGREYAVELMKGILR